MVCFDIKLAFFLHKLSILGKKFSNLLKHFPQKIGFTFMQIVSIEDNLHVMSNSIFWEKYRKKNIIDFFLLNLSKEW